MLAAREPTLAVLTAALGVVLVIAGNILPSTDGDANELLSNYRRLLRPSEPHTWLALPPALLAPAAIVVLVLTSRARLRPPAAGLLAGLGLEGYLLSVPPLAIGLSAGERKAAFAWLVLALGSLLVAVGAALLYARSEDAANPGRDGPRGLDLPTAVLAVAGGVAVAAATVLPTVYVGFDETSSMLGLDGAYRWLALEPAVLGGIAVVIVLFLAVERSRTAVGGALAGLGAMGLVSFAALYGLTSEGAASPRFGTVVALAGCLTLLVVGVLAIASGFGRRGPALQPTENTLDPRTRETTRQLAAAAQLDARLARVAVRHLVKDRHRAVAPSYGVELAPVLRHCLAARGRRTALAALLAGLSLPLVLAAANVGTGLLVAVIVVVTAWAAIFTERWVARYRIAARHLAGTDPDPALGARYLPPGSEHRVRELAAAESGNLVVYSGYSPHVGSGFNQGGWSFAVNVTKGRKELAGPRAIPRPFTARELYGYVTQRLDALALEELRISDRLYVDGECVRDDPRFLPHRMGRPRTQLTPAELDLASAAPIEVARRVHCVSVSGWGGEVVFTVFLSFVLKGSSLFVEATYYVLAPPAAKYREIDAVDPRPPFGERLRLLATALWATLILPFTAVRTLDELPAVWSAWRRRKAEQRQIARNPRFDYGARISIRELAQAPEYRRYFQAHDREMMGKIVEREVIDAVVTFLDAHDVDTTELEERGAAVLNNGVLVTGGELKAESLAVGAKSRAKTIKSAGGRVPAGTKPA